MSKRRSCLKAENIDKIVFKQKFTAALSDIDCFTMKLNDFKLVIIIKYHTLFYFSMISVPIGKRKYYK